jgi:hypothetical protein
VHKPVRPYRFLADLSSESSDNQFPGWPITISQLENYGRKIYGYLPDLNFESLSDPVVRVINEDKGELVYALRINGNSFSPFVFKPGNYSIVYGNPETDNWDYIENLRVWKASGMDSLLISE